ncbi:hypothetical protein [Spiroplasma poulsonii]|uniref:hypothetical protein n=1 Tax=Spiroplasma poulsonii TaxID=2138 RepID=UPI000D65B741|nr:hypothetical protein [Spiroplasma poulsonii]
MCWKRQIKSRIPNLCKTKYSANKNIKNETRENNSLVDDYNTHYEKNKGDPPKMSEEELEQLLVELDNLD